MKQHPEWIKEQVRERIAAGETQTQLSKELGISRYSIQNWCGLRPETKLRQIAPLPKGRQKKIRQSTKIDCRKIVVRAVGLEPTRLSTTEPKGDVTLVKVFCITRIC